VCQTQHSQQSECAKNSSARKQRLQVLLDLQRRKLSNDEARSQIKILTTCAKTRCKNTLMTSSFIGNTAWMICASWSTVDRISFDNAVSPGSAVGAGLFESFNVAQLQKQGRLVHVRDKATVHAAYISSTGAESMRGVPSGFNPDASSRTLSLEMKKSC